MFDEADLSELSLDELHTRIRIRAAEALSAVRFLTAAAPFCAQALDLVEADLRETVAAATAAQELELEVVRLVAGPRPRRRLTS